MDGWYLKTQAMTVGYDGPLIRDITLEIRRGEIVALIGPNGSGKSTILKSISRQLRLLGGEVFVAGEELRRLSGRALATRMAVMLTERGRPELMTCRDVVAMGRYPYTGKLGLLTTADERQVDAAMEEMRVSELRDRDFNAISDGQRERVLLARARCQQPEIIVLDEPTSFLDIRHKLELLARLRGLARERGITVILSLHEIDLAQKLADRIVCVRGERIALSGAPEDVLREDAVRALYDMDEGSFDPLFGSVELPRVEGEPRAFVICGCGAGIPVFRRLQREGVPFAAGILFTNDIDCRLARRLAVEVVEAEPFEPVGEEALARAMALMERCERVIDCGVPLGRTNRRVGELIGAARRHPGYEALPRV